MCDDPDIKLSRLIQYTSYMAREAISSCQLIGGSVGYKKALDILHRRFGNSQLVTERVISGLRTNKRLQSPVEIRQLSDDLKAALLVLNEHTTKKEANCQVVILEIVDRLPRFVKMGCKNSP